VINDWIVLEGLMYQFWKPDIVTAERKRIRQTWFDYRHLHPVMRSFVFVHEYNEAYKRAYKRHYGKPKEIGGDLFAGAKTSLYKRNAHTLAITLSRMHLIDELGCPYDSYFNAAFDHFMIEKSYADWRTGHKHLDRMPLPPLVMLADASSMISSQKAFEHRNVFKLRLPKHPHYFASNWSGTANQKACAKWLINTVRQRVDRDVALARLAYEEDLLREKEIVKYLSLDAVKSMRVIRKTTLNKN